MSNLSVHSLADAAAGAGNLATTGLGAARDLGVAVKRLPVESQMKLAVAGAYFGVAVGAAVMARGALNTGQTTKAAQLAAASLSAAKKSVDYAVQFVDEVKPEFAKVRAERNEQVDAQPGWEAAVA